MSTARLWGGPLRLVVVLVLAAAGFLGPAPAAMADAPAHKAETAKFEVAFMTGMIDHHHMGVEMGQVCVDNAIHKELRLLCKDVIHAQSHEIETMQSWLEDWYAVEHEPQMTEAEKREIDELSSLSGEHFEIKFMESLIHHHRQAIAEADMCVDRASHHQLIHLCADMIATQRHEIDHLETWLCQWYDRCRRHE